MSNKDSKAGASAADTATTGGALATVPTGGAVAIAADLQSALEGAAGQGLQNIKREDTALPFLGILQDLSPQVKRSEPQFIEGAQAGHFYESVAKAVLDGQIGIIVVPLLFDKVYNIWRDRKAGGGFFGTRKTQAEAEARVKELATDPDEKKRINPATLQIVDTALHYVLYQVPSTGQWKPALLSCKSTMLKVSRRWNNIMQTLEVPRSRGGVFTPPSWGTIYHLTTHVERKDQNSWFNFDVEYNGLITDPELFTKAQAMYKSLVAGEVKVDFSKDDTSTADTAEAVGASVDDGKPKF